MIPEKRTPRGDHAPSEMRSNRQPTAMLESRESWVLLLFFAAAYILAQSAAPRTPMRWGIYAVPLVSVALALVTSNKRFIYDRRFAIGVALYGGVAGASLLVNPRMSFTAIRDVLIISGALITFLPMFPISTRQISALVAFITAGVVPSIWGGPEKDAARAVTGAGGEIGNLDFAGSQGPLESVAAFPLTALALFFFIRKSWFGFFVCAILSVITFKRIAFLGFFAGAAFYVVAHYVETSGKFSDPKRWVRGMALAALIIVAVAGMTFDTTYDLLAGALGIGGAPSEVTLGRYGTAQHMRGLIRGSSAPRQLVGHGPGSGTQLPSVGMIHNVHNDFLKLYYEYGMLGAAVLVLMFFIIYEGSAATLAILMYNATLMLTDNTLIYFFHQFVCFAIVRCFRCGGDPVAGEAYPWRRGA